MNTAEILDLLEGEISNFPIRASGEELYTYMIKRTACLVKSDRDSLVQALREWLILRSEPRTMLALEIIAKHKLSELRKDIENLLSDVQNGYVFKSFYKDPIANILKEL